MGCPKFSRHNMAGKFKLHSLQSPNMLRHARSSSDWTYCKKNAISLPNFTTYLCFFLEKTNKVLLHKYKTRAITVFYWKTLWPASWTINITYFRLPCGNKSFIREPRGSAQRASFLKVCSFHGCLLLKNFFHIHCCMSNSDTANNSVVFMMSTS